CTGDKLGADCFTGGQIDTLKQVYGGAMSRGKPYFPGQPVGAEKIGMPPFGATSPESGWAGWLLVEKGLNRQLTHAQDFLRYLAFGKSDPGYDWHGFDFDADPARMGEARAMLDATDPDLSAF